MVRATALSFILLACGAAILAAATPASAATKPCWKQVVDDWSQDANIDRKYSARCIEEAIDKVGEDIRAYSDFEEQARAARVTATPDRTLQNVGGGSDTPAAGDGATAGEESQMLQERDPEAANNKDETPVGWALGTNGNNADSIPIPLLILLGLSGALLAAGGAGFAVRKVRARRLG